MSRRQVLAIAGAAGLILVVGASAAAFLLLGGPATPKDALGPPSFVEETGTSGVDHTYASGDTDTIGGGVAVLDCDNNGLPDLHVAGGANPAALYRNQSEVGGGLSFSPVEAGPIAVPGVMGAYPLDIDGDGHVDLAVLRMGGVDLLQGLGDCRFERANERWSFSAPPSWATAFSATWEGTAALPTLAVGSYVGVDASGNATYTCPDNELFRPDPSGTGY
ncbi:MAG: VCBS repeat-containing protein, partial [Chloroflexi bacterium]|nr:VCBS repeat-containing protein [Chloroflexota bacterium]